MQNHIIPILLFAAASLPAYAQGFELNEPGQSAMAQGHWVKVNVTDNGIYGFTHQRLRDLGFENPEAVHVYGYDPTVLLDHDLQSTPSDMHLLQSVNENGQLAFYAVGNVDYRSELWPSVPFSAGGTVTRRVHAYSNGGTYFLSDAPVQQPRPSVVINAPETIQQMRVYSSHDAVIYHEENINNLSQGGIWFCGQTMPRAGSEKHHLSVHKATGSAYLSYIGLMSISSGTASNNKFITEYSNGIKSSTLSGTGSRKLPSYVKFNACRYTQTLTFPGDIDDDFDFDVTFSPNPGCGPFVGKCALDFFALVYKRRNDLDGESNLLMYFNNNDSVAVAALAGINADEPWHVWNVTDMANVKEHQLMHTDLSAYAYLPMAEKEKPNTLVAFRTDMALTEPQVVGAVPNQNLHGIDVPDMVIVAAKPMLEAAEDAADFHRELQGIDVAVVDQQQIFNEYGSGNISPESLRRFFAHLYHRNPDKFKAILLIGSGHYNNANTVNDDSEVVVTAQMEIYDKATYETLNECTDAFFGTFIPRNATHSYYKLISAGMNVPVGRLPFGNIADVKTYYNKARRFICDTHSYPASGNIVVASDYAPRNDDSHMANGEALINSIPAEKRELVTATRAASNMYSINNNNVTRRVLLSTLGRGANLYVYFGHGSEMQIGGSNTSMDYLTSSFNITSQNHPGHYPLIFVGSCNVGGFDQYPTNLGALYTSYEHGGGIGVISASRRVFQARNEALGTFVVKAFYNLQPGEWLGKVWQEGYNGHLKSTSDTEYILNTAAYNYFGDPALPLIGISTHSIEFNEFDTLLAGGENTLSGRLIDGEGNVDTNFSGNVLLTVYDSPIIIKNLAPGSNTVKVPLDECELDQEIIGEYIGTVSNGEFSVTFRGPRSGRPATHRIQAYAYSANDEMFALGSVSATMADAETPWENIDSEQPSINKFLVDNGDSDGFYTEAVTLHAEINTPAGIADGNLMLNPVRLTIDGNVLSNIRQFLVPSGNQTFTLDYRLSNISGGRHTAELLVLDANGNIAEAQAEFTIDNAPKANLSVAIDGTEAYFELAFDRASKMSKAMLIIENLAGETVKYISFENNSASCNVNDLKSGAYRAYVQIEGEKFAAATPKIEVIIN